MILTHMVLLQLLKGASETAIGPSGGGLYIPTYRPRRR